MCLFCLLYCKFCFFNVVSRHIKLTTKGIVICIRKSIYAYKFMYYQDVDVIKKITRNQNGRRLYQCGRGIEEEGLRNIHFNFHLDN
ncbi:hypothetical protein JHK87_044337 [Glycine soja]|nr:hypothetical protein JHK87_044337 [Glycine soja]